MHFGNSSLNGVKREENFSFSKYTTYGLGGTAETAFFPETEEECAAVFDYARANYKKFAVLGNGSDVLASDGHFDGAVICTRLLNKIEYKNGVLKCMSGVTVNKALKYCVEKGLSGIEYLAGIPASIGGLAYMNGGIGDKHIENNIKTVTVYDGKYNIFSNKNCNFGNKHSTMRDINCIILSAELTVTPSKSGKVKKNISKYSELRKHQPVGKSCGCVFKNPEGYNAGRLIDAAGLKGFSLGCAEISAEHANFIINKGSCAADVFNLIGKVKRAVFEKFGVNLEEEVIYIGEFNDSDS